MQEANLMNLTLKSINLGGVRNSSPAFAGSPFGSAKNELYEMANPVMEAIIWKLKE